MRRRKKARPDQKQKTLRAFEVYLGLLDTAEYLRKWMRGPLELFDLTMQGFRLLVILHRDGPTPMFVAANELRCTRQNLNVVVARMEQRGWVRREMTMMQPAPQRASRLPKARRALPRQGRRVGILRLTRDGMRIIATALPRHAKVVKALMRALDGREQEHLSRLCRKLREGDVLKFVSEIRLVDDWEQKTWGEDEIEESEEEESPAEIAAPGPSDGSGNATTENQRGRPRSKPVPPGEDSLPWRMPGRKNLPMLQEEIEAMLRADAEESLRRQKEWEEEHGKEVEG